MVWRFMSASGFTEFYFPIESEKEQFLGMVKEYFDESKSVKDIWKPLTLLRKSPMKTPHFIEIENTGLIAIREDALAKGKSFFEGVELLPLITDAGNFYLINIINFVDCLDVESSDLSLLESGQIANFSYLSFHAEKLENIHFFKIPELPYRTLITHDALVFFDSRLYNGLLLDKEINYISSW